MRRATRLATVREHTGNVADERRQREQHAAVLKINSALTRADSLEARIVELEADVLELETNWRPFGRRGRTIKAMANANATLTTAETEKAFIRATGAHTALRTLTFTLPQPANEDEVVYRWFRNATTGGFAVRCAASYGGGTADVLATANLVLLAFVNGGVAVQ